MSESRRGPRTEALPYKPGFELRRFACPIYGCRCGIAQNQCASSWSLLRCSVLMGKPTQIRAALRTQPDCCAQFIARRQAIHNAQKWRVFSALGDAFVIKQGLIYRNAAESPSGQIGSRRPPLSRKSRRDEIMVDVTSNKPMTIGEGGLALIFAATAFICLIGAAKAEDVAFAFHAYLSAAASCAAVLVILSHYYDRPAGLPPQEIDGKPNYQFGPIKLAAGLAVFWGIAGFVVGLWAALELAWPYLNFDLPWFNFGRDVILRGSKNLPRADRGRVGAVVRRARLQFLHRNRRNRVLARRHAVEGIR
jgi:hypothetical protein